jgi:hypothetical protein
VEVEIPPLNLNGFILEVWVELGGVLLTKLGLSAVRGWERKTFPPAIIHGFILIAVWFS